MSELVINYLPITEIHPYANNPRDNNDKAVKAVMASIQTFGFLNPIVVDTDGVIAAGHTRYTAALKLGLVQVPTVSTDNLTQDQIKAFRLADNKTAQMAVWDLPLLDAAVQDIGKMVDGNEINLQDFGFTLGLPDIDIARDTAKQFTMEDFADETFACECPECGFRFNPRK